MKMPPLDLRLSLAVVTGAGSGIGAALALALARRGSTLALTDVDADSLQATLVRVRSAGAKASGHVLDLAEPQSARLLRQAVLEAHGRASVLVNNAGVALGGTFAEVDAGDFDWLMRVNFEAPVRLTREFLPVLAAEPVAQLVNVSSIFGLIAPPRQTAYCASKFALRGFSESLRHELEMAGSTTGVTLVHPGGVRTAIAERARLPDAADEQERERYRRTWKALLALSPDEAAARIVRAIERREARVLIGRDAAQAAWLQRLAPVRYWSWVRRGLERRVARAA